MSQPNEKLIDFLLYQIRDYSSDDDFLEICEKLSERGCHLCSFIMSSGPGKNTVKFPRE